MIKIENLSKSYDKKVVYQKLNIQIDIGSVLILLGLNGSGKSTLINLLTDYVKPDSGTMSFDNMDFATDKIKIKRNIGLMSEENSLIEEFTGFEYLTFVGRLYEIKKNDLYNRIHSLQKYFFDEENIFNKRINAYSTGNKKKMELCAAVLNTPKYLILDEPFANLDPIAAIRLINFIKEYENKDRIVIISSHNLEYIEKVASHILLIDNGQIIFQGTLNEFTENGKNKIDNRLLETLGYTGKENIEELKWAF